MKRAKTETRRGSGPWPVLRAAVLAAMLAGAIGAPPLLAYGHYVQDGNPVIRSDAMAIMNLHPFSFDVGSDAELAVMYALLEWNLVTGSSFEFFIFDPPIDTDPLDNEDGVDTVSFLIPEAFPAGVFAATLISVEGNEILEADTAFNSGVPWTLDIPDPTPPYENIDFIGVAGHEFGHALGLLHEDRRIVARMNSTYSQEAAWIVHADDRLGLRTLYPGEGLEVELYGHAWIKETDGTEAAIPSPNPAPDGLEPGDGFQAPATVENLGNATSGSFSIAYLLSEDGAPSADDILVGGLAGISAPGGAVGTVAPDLTVPAGTPPGEYFLILVVDSEGTIAEPDEEENHAVFADPIRILEGATSETFRRGDANGDGGLDLADAIRALDHMFAAGDALDCPDAADWDDDGALTIGDPIGLLSYLFASADPSPPPGPLVCGVDPTADGLGACDDPHCP
ncbi:MAG: matrixin family metalloprotease [Planctomycetes bacterium]|nr:matrixin family metalloprotease [Planctomycetota bacterium]